MKSKLLLSFVLLLTFLNGCVAEKQWLYGRPSDQAFAMADYGVYPEDYREIIKSYLEENLYDPYSLRDLEISKPGKSWVSGSDLTKTPPMFGYECVVGYNAKNRMGGYVGRKDHVFLIRNGGVVFTFEERFRYSYQP